MGALVTHYVAPDIAPVRKALLIVAPLCEERKAVHPSLTSLARLLAAQDVAVLSFDARGCGDSPGAFSDFGPPDWLDDLAAAATWLRQCHPDVPQVWLGTRLGALLALHSAATVAPDAQPAALMLWEPVTGTDFVRQLVQRHLINDMLAHGRAQMPRREIEQQLAGSGTVDLDGFAVTARQAAQLAALVPCPWRKPALVISTGPDQATADACQRLAPAATRLRLRLPPFWNTVGLVDTSTLTRATADWLAQVALSRPAASLSATDTALPDGPAAEDATASRESLVSFPGQLGMLRAVLHRPAEPARGRLLLLHGWSGDRTGPHRMFVHAARLFAAQGQACLRLDFGGRGDSDGMPAEATIASMTADARAALAWLRHELPSGGPLGILAICSGCKVAIRAAAAEPDVARLALWSAETMGALRQRGVTRHKRLVMLGTYARKLLHAETWRKLLGGRVRAGMVGRALVQPEVRSAAEARAEDAVLRQFRAFHGELLFVWGGSDADTPVAAAAYARFCRTHTIPNASQTVPHAGHSFYGLDWERQVLDATAQWLSAR